jgi:hypothetical protein
MVASVEVDSAKTDAKTSMNVLLVIISVLGRTLSVTIKLQIMRISTTILATAMMATAYSPTMLLSVPLFMYSMNVETSTSVKKTLTFVTISATTMSAAMFALVDLVTN